MNAIDTEKLGLLIKAFKVCGCGQIDENCLECPYRKHGWRCIRELNKDATSILSTIYELFDVKDRVISSVPGNKEAWKKYAETLNNERVAALEKENAELRSKLDRIYDEQIKELKVKQSKLEQELLYSEMHYGGAKND